MKNYTLSKLTTLALFVILMAISATMPLSRAQAQAVDPNPSLYTVTATQFSMPYLQSFGNGYDMFYQQIVQFLSFLNGSQSMYAPGYTYVQSQSSNSHSSSASFDRPDAETEDADDVTDDSAELNGEIDMNDAEDGTVFFVYGEDEDEVDDVEDEDSYSDIDENDEDLQKVRVESRFDGRDDFREDIGDLRRNRKHYFRICVEYEDEDGDETLECGSVEEFRTDN